MPKLPPLAKEQPQIKSADAAEGDAKEEKDEIKEDKEVKEETGEGDEEEEARLLDLRQKTELERLHRLGIPVPGVTIRVDKMSAVVWLETLEVDCPQKVFADRVRAVVERAVEVTAPLWG